MTRKIVIAGGSGFLGELATRHFIAQGWRVVVLSRASQKHSRLIRQRYWDGKTVEPWQQELEGAHALLNLSGRSVDCRYTSANRQEIIASRIDSTHCLANAVAACQHPPKVWINASSATIYRHAYEPQDEVGGEAGNGFSVEVCQQWEQAFFEKQVPGVRKVALRMGIVLGSNAGALLPMKRLVQLGLGGCFGSGTQYMSWLHQHDYLRILEFIISTTAAEGTINATAPQPLPNRLFLKAMRKTIGIPFGLPLPRPLLALGALLIRTETELILKSRCVVPRRLQELGFEFRYPTAEEALQELLGKKIPAANPNNYYPTQPSAA
ncbi:TIGR01777 family oxidoreductase [Cesiribacter sp. SM1]|uniref:TIGR01777 family oxidoreductase n=1 Tax=Cesiribacter sp. SM1 TaxID=2861196 RepID=UPI001CD4A66F|nr:TIGR01777 family oxidoreductase [Cesiribacter sp. SM1]